MTKRPEKRHSKLRWRSATLATCATCACLLAADVATAQPCIQEVVLRATIGPGSSTTNGNTAYASLHEILTDTAYVSATILNGRPDSGVQLTYWRTIASWFYPDFQYYNWYVRIWSSEQATANNPRVGDVGNCYCDVPTTGPTQYGTDYFGNTTYQIEFNLSQLDIAIPQGSSIVIGVTGLVNDISHGGIMGIMESSEAGTHEKNFGPTYPSGWCWTDDLTCFPESQYDGRYAFEVRGIITVELPGDLDADGDVDLTDAESFISCMSGPEQPNPGCDPPVFERADIDDDTDTDMSDFAVLQVQFGQSCP